VFERSLVEPRLCHGMDVTFEDYRPAAVIGAEMRSWLRQQSAW